MGRVDNRPVNQPSVPVPVKSHQEPLPVMAPVPSHPVPGDKLSRSVPQGQAMTRVEIESPAPPTTHTVKANESLSSIAKKYFGNPNLYLEIFKLNRDTVKHPNQIQVGMVLNLPAHLFPKSVQPAPTPAVQPTQTPATPTDKPAPKPVQPAQTLPPAKTGPALDDYRRQNPLSYVTLDKDNELKVDSTHMFPGLLPPWAKNNGLPLFSPLASHSQVLDDIAAGRDQTQGTSVTHEDAVKVNKRFDISPALTTRNLATQFAPWAREVAGVLRANQASISLPNPKGQPVTLTADKLEALAGMHIGQAADYFRKDLGIALFNTLFAIDDVASDMKHDPYYADVRNTPKTVDLAAVAERFNLLNDNASYLAHTAAHRHKQVPILLQGAAVPAESRGPVQTPAQMLSGLANHFNAKGALTHPAEFEADVYKLLENQSARRQLIQRFGLDSAESLNVLAPAITSEAGMADNQRTYNSYFAVGSVMLNRALGRNLRKAAADLAQGKPADKFKPVGMRDIIFEQGQFEITWRQMPNTKGQTFFQHSQNLNQAFLKDKLGGGSREAFETAYEAARDLASGMHQLQADVNGASQKNSGRSTGSLFYFNQSRSQDFSQSESAAVSLVDSNNTHVFFKEWDKRAYFRD
ncbi:MAG TPA: LysM peptidoglycan-binding domain-containing protein [Candidatus Obscuribacterales bacterium]